MIRTPIKDLMVSIILSLKDGITLKIKSLRDSQYIKEFVSYIQVFNHIRYWKEKGNGMYVR